MAGLPQSSENATRRSGLNSGKLGATAQPHQPPMCPECGSCQVWKDGLRRTTKGVIQRYLCRTCGLRFSDSTTQLQVKVDVPREILKVSDPGDDDMDLLATDSDPALKKIFDQTPFHGGKYVRPHRSSSNRSVPEHLNMLRGHSVVRRVCAEEVEAKNLAEVESRTEKRAAGATEISEATVKGKIVEYIWHMKQQGYREEAIRSYADRIEILLRKGVILSDPDQTKRIIASVETWNDGTKKCMADAYDVYVKMEGLEWEKPHYKPRSSLPFIPTEKEVDQLIAGCGFNVRVFLQGLKETGAGAGELLNIKWKDVDFDRRKLAINYPTKGHNPRILDVSDEWLRMVSKLPRTGDRVWPVRYMCMSANYRKQRSKLAREYSNPRLREISFRTFRHWKGTMLYHETDDPYYVKEFLGHKTLKSTEIYIHLEEGLFESLKNEFIVRRAVSAKGMMALAATGFDKFDEVNGVHLYKKRRIAL